MAPPAASDGLSFFLFFIFIIEIILIILSLSKGVFSTRTAIRCPPSRLPLWGRREGYFSPQGDVGVLLRTRWSALKGDLFSSLSGLVATLSPSSMGEATGYFFRPRRLTGWENCSVRAGSLLRVICLVCYQVSWPPSRLPLWGRREGFFFAQKDCQAGIDFSLSIYFSRSQSPSLSIYFSLSPSLFIYFSRSQCPSLSVI